MAAAAPLPEHRVRCLGHAPAGREGQRFSFEIDGAARHFTLRIEQLTRELVASLPPKALDLLELAAVVYAVDASVSRGGLADQNMGKLWHRRFTIEIPVRDPDIWATAPRSPRAPRFDLGHSLR